MPSSANENETQSLPYRLNRIIYASGLAILLAISFIVMHVIGLTDYSTTSTPALRYPSNSAIINVKAQSGSFLTYQLNTTKIASIIEPRNAPALLPILHNFLSVLPPDWPIVVWCSHENCNDLKSSRSLRPYLDIGKLTLRMLPKEYANLDGPNLSLFMIRPWFWKQFGQTQHVLIFQLDSILCSRSDDSVDNWLDYDFIGHPLEWAIDGRGGNGGLSLRKVSSMLRVANAYEARLEKAGRKPEYRPFPEWKETPLEERQYLYTAEDAFFVHALVEIDDAMGKQSTIKWPVQDGRSQARFAFDIWLYEHHSIEQVRPIGLHSGSGFASKLIQYDGEKYDEKSKSWIKYCPEIAYLRFIPE